MDAPTGPEIIIRPSSLPTYADCPRRTAAKMFRREIIAAGFDLRDLPTGAGAATGTATHAGAGHLLTEKLNTGRCGRSDDAIAASMAALDAEVANGVAWDDLSPTRSTAEAQVRRQVHQFSVQIVPEIEPEAVETRLEADLDAGVIITGQVDCRESSGLVDLKTGGYRRANGAQYGAYSLIHRAHGHRVDRLREVFLPRARLDKPQPPATWHSYDPEEAEHGALAVVRRIVADLREFRRTGEPWSFLANPQSSLCSARFCPAHSCGAGSRSFCNSWLRK